MPAATPFNALGKGNGFPFCPQKVDVSVYSSWTTLGGYRDTETADPTDAQISLSLKNAVKLFWNSNGITFDVDTTYTNPPNPNYVDYSATIEIDGSTEVDTSPYTYDKDEVEIYWRNLLWASNPTDFPIVKENQEPNERVCYKFGRIIKAKYRASEFSTDYQSILLYSSIIRMYNGVTTDEDNFVGYGANIAFGGGTQYGDQWELHLTSYATDDPSIEFCLTEYVDIGGMPCVATFVNYGFGYPISDDPYSTVTLSSNAQGVTGLSVYNYTGSNTNYTLTSQLVYKDIDFYTY